MSTFPDEIEAVFEAVRKAQWLAQIMDELDGPVAAEEQPRYELWLAISERITAARDAIDAIVFSQEISA